MSGVHSPAEPQHLEGTVTSDGTGLPLVDGKERDSKYR